MCPRERITRTPLEPLMLWSMMGIKKPPFSPWRNGGSLYQRSYSKAYLKLLLSWPQLVASTAVEKSSPSSSGARTKSLSAILLLSGVVPQKP